MDRTAELTDQAREAWEATAAGWVANADTIDRYAGPVKAWLVAHLDPKPGDTVLELAAGAGDTGFEVARRVAPDGRLISTDISTTMSEGARARAAAQGVTGVEFRVMDAQRIELDDSSVDAVVHRFGPMLLPDPAASMREVHRVLRPGGRYAAATWGPAQDNMWVLIGGMSAMQHGVQLEGDIMGPGGIFSLTEPAALESLAIGAGFTEVTAEPLDLTMEFTGFDELWRVPSETSGPLALALGRADAPTLEAVKESFREAAARFASGDGYAIPAKAIVLAARKA